MVFPFLASAFAEETAEEIVEAKPAWSEELVEKFTETPATVWIAVAVVAALGLILLAISRSSKQWTAKTIAYAALAIALSFVLSCFRLYRMPQGGSVTPGSMLPLMLFSAAFGVGPGLAAGVAMAFVLMPSAPDIASGTGSILPRTLRCCRSTYSR